MKSLASIVDRFRAEEDGAAMVEYSILIGLITAATITFIVLIGLWVTGQWTALSTAVAGKGAAPAA